MADCHSNIQRLHAQPSPRYEFSISQRAALQVLGHAMEYVAGAHNRQAASLLWAAREQVLKCAEHEHTQQACNPFRLKIIDVPGEPLAIDVVCGACGWHALSESTALVASAWLMHIRCSHGGLALAKAGAR